MNTEYFKSKNGPATIKMTPDDVKKMEEEMSKGLALINITEYLNKEGDQKFKFNLEEKFIRLKFINEFLGQSVQEYDQNFAKQMSTCLFLNTACNYQTMKKYLFSFKTDIVKEDNNDFNRKYEIVFKIKELGKETDKYRFITFYQNGNIFFNVYYGSLLLSMELITLWLLELEIEIEIVKRKKN